VILETWRNRSLINIHRQCCASRKLVTICQKSHLYSCLDLIYAIFNSIRLMICFIIIQSCRLVKIIVPLSIECYPSSDLKASKLRSPCKGSTLYARTKRPTIIDIDLNGLFLYTTNRRDASSLYRTDKTSRHLSLKLDGVRCTGCWGHMCCVCFSRSPLSASIWSPLVLHIYRVL
jgi:hypothetical protein